MSGLRGEHRERLAAHGVPADLMERLGLHEVTAETAAEDGWTPPAWWADLGNTLYLRRGMGINADVLDRMVAYPFAGALLVIATGTDSLASLLIGGDDATVWLGPDSHLSFGEIYCGAGSSVLLLDRVVGTRNNVVDARNGGSILAERDQLWAANVYVATDDMHRFEDAETGARLNPYGAHVRLGEHVWIGRDAIVTGHVDIGHDVVVGAKSLVRGMKVPPYSAVGGVPARVIREGVTWSADDLP
jgi:acetyltransferase-like isoleucine patch superfamily enzyme